MPLPEAVVVLELAMSRDDAVHLMTLVEAPLVLQSLPVPYPSHRKRHGEGQAAWDKQPLCSTSKAPPAVLGKGLRGHTIRLGGKCMKGLLVPSPWGIDALVGIYHGVGPSTRVDCIMTLSALVELVALPSLWVLPWVRRE